jgi:hypothetical protein
MGCQRFRSNSYSESPNGAMRFPLCWDWPPEQPFILPEEGQLIGPHQSNALLQPVVIKSKAPPLKEKL